MDVGANAGLYTYAFAKAGAIVEAFEPQAEWAEVVRAFAAGRPSVRVHQVALGSSESVYRSVEFLIDFFRSTPSSALIPLFLLIFGISDFNKVAISAFAAVLVILFNSAYGVMNAKKTRIMAASVMGSTRSRTPVNDPLVSGTSV